MRQPISQAEMQKYLDKALSADELIEFEERLQEAGLQPGVRGPAASRILDSIRPDDGEETFDEDVLLSFIKGECEPRLAAVIAQMRRVDPSLEMTLGAMERAKREVDASLNLTYERSTQRPKRPAWFRNLSLGLSLAGCAAVITLVFLSTNRRNSPLAQSSGSLEALLSAKDLGPSTQLSSIATAGLAGTPVSFTPDAQSQLASLVSLTKDTAQMEPARCLVLPGRQTRLTWQGIHAKSVTCSLMDPRGAVLAEAKVTTKNTWVYRKPLPAGEYSWTAAWIGKGGQAKRATRRFRVVDSATVATMLNQLRSAGDPVSRSIVLARNGYTYQSLAILDEVQSRSPSITGLKKLRDTIAKEAIL